MHPRLALLPRVPKSLAGHAVVGSKPDNSLLGNTSPPDGAGFFHADADPRGSSGNSLAQHLPSAQASDAATNCSPAPSGWSEEEQRGILSLTTRGAARDVWLSRNSGLDCEPECGLSEGLGAGSSAKVAGHNSGLGLAGDLPGRKAEFTSQAW